MSNLSGYESTLNKIHSLSRFGSQLNLDRMRALLQMMGNPQDKLKFVHVAGTNGKGTVCQMCTSVLKCAGYVVGTFTSPYVLDFAERFKVGNIPANRTALCKIAESVLTYGTLLETQGFEITEFEAVTAIGIEYFAQSSCDIVILEVGIGGKFDATNIITTPLAAIIGSISMDHMKILGDTIEKIAGEKAGIIKENTDVVSYPIQQAEAVTVLKNKCEETNSTIVFPELSNLSIKVCNETGSMFNYEDNAYRLRFVGEHQIYNALAAIEAMKILRTKGFNISQYNVKEGLFSATLYARFECLSKKPLIYLDGAHNVQAMTSLSASLDFFKGKKKVAIIGMMKDKDYENSLKVIAQHCDAIVAIPIDCKRALSVDELATCAKKYCSNVASSTDYFQALKTAAELSGDDGVIVICGSFYLGADMVPLVKELRREYGAIPGRARGTFKPSAKQE